jgi:hypothetical protein
MLAAVQPLCMCAGRANCSTALRQPADGYQLPCWAVNGCFDCAVRVQPSVLQWLLCMWAGLQAAGPR